MKIKIEALKAGGMPIHERGVQQVVQTTWRRGD